MKEQERKLYEMAFMVSSKAEAKRYLNSLVENRRLTDPFLSKKELEDYMLGHISWAASKVGPGEMVMVKEFYGVEHPFIGRE